MNETSLEAMLESFDNLPDLVFNYLNEADPATTNQQITFVVSLTVEQRAKHEVFSIVHTWYLDLQVLWRVASMSWTPFLETLSAQIQVCARDGHAALQASCVASIRYQTID